MESDGYVNSITTKAGEKLEAYSDSNWNYYGWNYCVIRDGKKLVDGDTLSASVLEVEKDDEVIWAFGTATQAENYFNRILAE